MEKMTNKFYSTHWEYHLNRDKMNEQDLFHLHLKYQLSHFCYKFLKRFL